jgi:hypothetical protein
VIIGVTDENVSTVDSWFKRATPRYPIVILEDNDFEKALGVKFFPTGAVLDPEGKIAYAGSAGGTGSPLKEALSDGLKSPLFPKALTKVQQAMADGDLEKAWSGVVSLKAKAGKDPEQDAWVDRFEATLAQQAADSLAEARKADEDGLTYRAVEILEPLAEAKEPFPVSGQAADWLAEIQGREGYADELKAGAQYQKGVEAEKEREFTDAAKAYAKAASKYPDTRLAEAAHARASFLVEGGWCGYESTCADCKQGDRACNKHDEGAKVKL